MILKGTSRIARWGRLLFLPRFGCSRSHLSARNNSRPVRWLAILSLLSLWPTSALQALELHSDTPVATAGYFQLHWSGARQGYELQESASADFTPYRVIYRGPDEARVMSGKPDGNYYYRVVSDGLASTGQISQVVKVTVAHHPLRTAVLFFIAGAIVFIATIALIVKGNRQSF